MTEEYRKENNSAENPDYKQRVVSGKIITLESRMRQLLRYYFIPVTIIIAILIGLLVFYAGRYSRILHNVTTASEFNQDFKESIDLKMYYYVVDSQYSEGLPVTEVQDAQLLAQRLLSTTTQKESYAAINDVLNLCMNLENKIYQIETTQSYDDRQIQLENNIYVLTKLIQEYMYSYIYHEASLLDSLQRTMMQQLEIEIVLLVLLMIIVMSRNVQRTREFGKSITKPIQELCSRVWDIREGNLKEQKPVEAQEYEIKLLSNGFESMVGHINRLIEQNRQEQTRLRSAELALLQAQINPHFLYNTLDAIVWLIEMEKNDQAVEMVTSLSSFFRSSLSNGRDIITIREEEQQIRSYLEIQQVRYKDILSYEIDIDDEIMEARIPKLTLQPLVENALYHGIKLKRGQGHILVRGHKEEQKIILTVEDDGAGIAETRLQEIQASLQQNRKMEDLSAVYPLMESGRVNTGTQKTGFGMATVHQRIRLLFGSSYGLQIESSAGKGSLVTVVIPCEELQEEI